MKTSTFKDLYEETTDDAVNKLSKFNWEDLNCYANWLAQTYFFVRYSTRLLSLAAGNCNLEQEQLHKRFLKHLREESGHELIAVKDLSNMGFKLSNFTPLPAIQSFYELQVFKIESIGPHSFMGWICFLEGIAMKFGSTAASRTTAHGKNCTHFLRVHGEEDIEHIQSAMDVIEQFSPAELTDVIQNMYQAKELYMSMISQIGTNAIAFSTQKAI
jgi:hypothetical protein